MKEYIFDKVNESIFKETLDCGVDVYMYPFTKTKNFYCSITVNYGSKHIKYKKGNKIHNIIPGSAHFLEHRVMLLGEDPVISKRIDALGSLPNAWTNYHATNYNIFGSENIVENIKILLDLFYNPKFLEKDIESEKGIITEEIDMGKDQIDRFISDRVYKNSFSKLHVVNTVIGEKEDVNKINCKSLKKIYDDFYIPNNTFIVISGNFDKDDVMNEIKKYYSSLDLKRKEIPKRIIPKEPNEVAVDYEEIKKDMEDIRVIYVIKMKKNIFGIKDDSILQCYLDSVLKLNFSPTSKLYEKYKDDDLIFGMSAYTSIVDNYLLIIVKAVTNTPTELINNLKNDINNLSLNKEEFERNKKRYIKNYIMSFENIDDVEYDIVDSISKHGKIDFDDYEFISNLSYSKAVSVMKKIDTKYTTIIKTIK